MGRSTFSHEEADELRRLLREKESADRSRQKTLRGKMRRIGFRVSDFDGSFGGFTVADFDALISSGAIKIGRPGPAPAAAEEQAGMSSAQRQRAPASQPAQLSASTNEASAGRDRDRLYSVLGELERRIGARRLRECDGRMSWPSRGVYFFFEEGETRSDGSNRVVRVGTHAVSAGSGTTLWNRLSQHKGSARSGGGNHRGSIFRLHAGSALIGRGDCIEAGESDWLNRSNRSSAAKSAEHPIEAQVSEYVGAMPFLWIEADDEPGPSSVRSFIERNCIALLSCASPSSGTADQPSASWLGSHCAHAQVRSSGIWNVNHTREAYDSSFLDVLDDLADRTPAS